MPRENSVPVRGWIPPSMCVFVYVWLHCWVCMCLWARMSHRKSGIFRFVHTLYHSMCVLKCKCLCTNTSERVYVCVRAPSALAKVIHHSKHQMTSPPTPILQLLPFHLPHIHHSDGLTGCHHPPSSSSSSSSLHLVLHLTQLCCCTESAESSRLATVYTRLTWVRSGVCARACLYVY